MKAPEGMKWIDVTYMAGRVEDGSNCVFEGEAGMRLLVAEDVAQRLVEGGPIAEGYYRLWLETVIAHREMLCHGMYVDGSIKDIRILEDDDE